MDTLIVLCIALVGYAIAVVYLLWPDDEEKRRRREKEEWRHR